MGFKVRVLTAVAIGLTMAVAAYAAGPKAYIGLFKDNAIAVLDTADNRLLSTIPVPPGPHGLAITPDGRTVFASSDGDSKVSVIDATSDTVAASIEVGKSPHGLAMTPDGKTVLAAVFGANAVVFIDVASRQVVGQVPAASPHNIAITPDGRTAYVAAQAKGATGLVIVDVARMRQTGFVALDGTPRALNVGPDGRKLYFTVAGIDAVVALDTGTNTIVRQVPVGASPHHPLFIPAGTGALVVSQGPGVLSLLDVSRDAVSRTVKVGTLPHWIAVTPGARFAYVTNEGSNDVSVVDLGSFTVSATVAVGNAPRKIVIQPSGPVATSGGPGSAASVVSASPVATSISAYAFADTLRIRAGQTVTWTNKDPVPHTVTSDDGTWTSGDIGAGKSFSRLFDTPGTYRYHCSNHPAMQGIVIVSAAA